MSIVNPSGEVPAVKDESRERPIPTAWRQAFSDIVEAFVAADYGLDRGVEGVEPLSAETAMQIQDYIQDYGAILVSLPEQTWSTSVCIWSGDHWESLVDLWTREEGPSDLVLHARVTDTSQGFTISVHLVCVP
jgi:hypothetical protein